MTTRVVISSKCIKPAYAQSENISKIFGDCASHAGVEVKHARGLIPSEIEEDGFELFEERAILKGETKHELVDSEVQTIVTPDFVLTGDDMPGQYKVNGSHTSLLVADFPNYEAATNFLRAFREKVLEEKDGVSVHGGLHIEKGAVPKFDPLAPTSS